MVDFPDADRPVNQTVQPFCLRRSERSARVSDGCQVMLLCRWHELVSPTTILWILRYNSRQQTGSVERCWGRLGAYLRGHFLCLERVCMGGRYV